VFVVSDPFPAEARKRNPSVSLAVREKMVTMRREGRQYKEIATTCGVSVDTVRRYLTEAKLVKVRPRKGRNRG
jgi:DNA-binding CsgD family transcriptional regulator